MCEVHLFYIVIYFKFTSKMWNLVRIIAQSTFEVTFLLSLSYNNVVIFTFFYVLMQRCGSCVHITLKSRKATIYAVIAADILIFFIYNDVSIKTALVAFYAVPHGLL